MRITMSSISMLTALALGFTVLAGGAGCSDDDDANPSGTASSGGTSSGGTSSGGTSGGNPDPNDPDGGKTPTEPPVYALASSVTAPSQTTYVIVTPSLTGELKNENAALEIAGSAILGGPPGGKQLFVGTGAGGELKRYDLGEDGATLTESGSVNFEAKQVPDLSGYGSGLQFIDAHKAYWLSLKAAKIIVWDPTDMVITADIPVPEIVRNNPDTPGTPYQASVTGAPIRDGNMLYYFTAWDSRNAGVIKMAPAAAVVAIDTAANTASVIVDEGTCGYTRDGVIAGDFIYLVTEGAGTSINYLNAANGAAPCMRRFNKATKQFDNAYKVDLNSLTGGAPVGSLVTSPSGQAFVYVLDKAAADPLIADGTISNPRILSVSSLWKTARLTVGDTPKIDVLDNPLASSSVLPHTLLGNFKVTATFDPKAYQVREVGDTGVVPTDRANATLPGNVGSIVQLR